MQATVDIKFDELLKIVKSLPENKLSILKQEIDKTAIRQKPDRVTFMNLLLSGPTFSKEQLENIAETRAAINQWRTK